MTNLIFLILILTVSACSSPQMVRSPSSTVGVESSRQISAIDSILQFYKLPSLEFDGSVRKAVSCISEQNANDIDAMERIMNTNENKAVIGQALQLIVVPHSQNLSKKQLKEEFQKRVSLFIHDFFKTQIRKASVKPYTAVACYMSGFRDH